ncbi:carbohydrate ABC transporter permease [Cryptosporangium phraense]|uniref:Sugar ABC transporter permease n=1 Tax=Cryptosporangium phraense TaxID=2593070 RepID=A0A545ARV9_9ACTN|nr:sugar ABC transporter permease [Cryptosporangium phraense]TQS44057.1 sugar ABC transporter permease [Cryptosporangium phraense]
MRDRLYLVPFGAAMLIWVYGPLVATVVISFLTWDLSSGPQEFAGAANYRALLGDADFGTAAGQTVLYAAGLLVTSIVLPLYLAVALWRRPGRAAFVYRCLLFVPMVLAPVATAISWQFVLNPLVGILGFRNWLGDPSTALATIVVITSGKLIALNTLLLSAALTSVDGDTVEAARIDGASEGRITRRIVVPQVGRTLVLLGMLTVVYAGQWSFTNIAVLTQGGPSHSTDNVYYRLYTYGFQYFDLGGASAGSVLVVCALAIPLAVGAVVRRG